MMELIIQFLTALNTMSPLAVIALLGLVLWQMAKNQKTIADNHLHGLPMMETKLGEIAETLQQIEVKLATEFSYLRARLNGRDVR